MCNRSYGSMSISRNMAHRDIITNGIRMHYVTQGEGPLVVLLHGFPEFWYSWRYQIPFLAEHGYKVVAPDLRGYNDTDKPRHGYDIPTLICDIEGLIQGLERNKEAGLARATVVGHDWGGVLAWEFAMAYPQMMERLVILNAPHPQAMQREMRRFKQLRKSCYMFFFQLPWLPEYLLLRNHANEIGRMLHAVAFQKSAFPREVTALYQEAMSKPGAMTAALNYYRQFFRQGLNTLTRANSHVSPPALVIWGEQDFALGIDLLKGLEQWVDNIQIERISDSGHWVQQEKPEVVNSLMLNFLKA